MRAVNDVQDANEVKVASRFIPNAVAHETDCCSFVPKEQHVDAENVASSIQAMVTYSHKAQVLIVAQHFTQVILRHEINSVHIAKELEQMDVTNVAKNEDVHLVMVDLVLVSDGVIMAVSTEANGSATCVESTTQAPPSIFFSKDTDQLVDVL